MSPLINISLDYLFLKDKTCLLNEFYQTLADVKSI